MSVAEYVGIVRDVLLIIAFLLAILVLFAIWRKISAILESARRALRSLEEVADAVSSRIVRPAAAGSGAAFGVGKLAAFVLGLSRRRKKRKKGKGGKDNGE